MPRIWVTVWNAHLIECGLSGGCCCVTVRICRCLAGQAGGGGAQKPARGPDRGRVDAGICGATRLHEPPCNGGIAVPIVIGDRPRRRCGYAGFFSRAGVVTAG